VVTGGCFSFLGGAKSSNAGRPEYFLYFRLSLKLRTWKSEFIFNPKQKRVFSAVADNKAAIK
jgi:hypothetical protein